jgi:PAP2 superfamily protein
MGCPPVTVTERCDPEARSGIDGTAGVLTNRWRQLPLELALLFSMFVAYRAGRLLTTDQTSTAFANAQDLWDVERWLRLPRETGVQDWFLQSAHAIELANTYYAVVHFPATVAFLVWMFLRRPAHYLWVRRAIVLLTATGLFVHVLFPLAPPRMRPDLGFIDTAATYGPDVYGPPEGGSIANQFAAMPSLHIGWAVLIAVGLIVSTRSRWRWLWLAHPIVTVLVVVGTANHWWLDGVVALVLLAATIGLASLVDRFTVHRLLLRERRATSPA